MSRRPVPTPFASLSRVRQITASHCGPAVVEMLLSHFGAEGEQDEIAKAGGVHKKISVYGMMVDEMGVAVKKLHPEFNFWYKRNCRIKDLEEMVRHYNYPAGIVWQGVFETGDNAFYEGFDYTKKRSRRKAKEEQERGKEEDAGHYCVVVDIDTVNNYVRVADPFGRYAGKDRFFTIGEFEKRWWDVSEIKDPKTKKPMDVDDYRLMFVILPVGIDFPESLGMVKF